VDASSDPPRPLLVPLSSLEAPEPVLLGVDDAGALFAVGIDGTFDGAVPMQLREAGARMAQEDGGLVAYAAAIINWHRTHPHCSRCGTATHIAEAGHVRECPNCGALHHPRTDPVVIMLVHDGDRALLGRQPTWPAGRYSALAGFVEPGESLEEAVAREVLEEAGIVVGDVLYRSSQPWPFPTSLMLGFHAAYVSGEPVVGDGELDDVRWFSREELSEIAGGGTEFHLPPPLAIARRLIDEWLGA
jgi:NAD+ diphosphatase